LVGLSYLSTLPEDFPRCFIVSRSFSVRNILSARQLRKRGRRAEEPRLGMNNQLYRQPPHHAFEPALGSIAVREARTKELIANSMAEAARDNRRRGALRKCEIPGDATER
jgi:hypothetical protein